MITYRITMDVIVDPYITDPETWDWPFLLDLGEGEDCNVIECEQIIGGIDDN